MAIGLLTQPRLHAGNSHKFSEKFIAPLRTFITGDGNTGVTDSYQSRQNRPVKKRHVSRFTMNMSSQFDRPSGLVKLLLGRLSNALSIAAIATVAAANAAGLASGAELS